MSKIVIADTSCLIVLEKINRIDLLQALFTEITVTPEVQSEYGNALPNWISVKEVQDKMRQQILAFALDKGEASAIALCLEQENCLLLIDEKKGRQIAEELGIKKTGTLGVIIKAKEKGMIQSIRQEIDELRKVDFRMSDILVKNILEKYER